MARGGCLRKGKGPRRKSRSELDFRHGQVERVGAWGRRLEAGLGCGDGRRGEWRGRERVTDRRIF